MVEEIGSPSVRPSTLPQPSRIHGFYSSALSGQELIDYEEALAVDGLENEIALLRSAIKAMITLHSQSWTLIIRAFTCLKGLIKTQKSIFGKDKDKLADIKESMSMILDDLGLPPEVLGAVLKKNLGQA